MKERQVKMTDKAVVYIHGRGGSPCEADHYRDLFKDFDVFGFDYKAETPWDASEEFVPFFRDVCSHYRRVFLIANSIGAFFAIHTLGGNGIEKAFFVSPVVHMEGLILGMMASSNVTEDMLREKEEIPVAPGLTLSYRYLSFVRNTPLSWHGPAEILYGSQDSMTSLEDVTAFAGSIGAGLTVMEGGEHWFHTKEQMDFLDRWIKERL